MSARAGPPAVVLVGPPGAGKSTVGRLLADRLGVGYRDTDADIEAAAGKPIPDIFIDQGEPHFRELERTAVRDALAGHDGVLSLGGGAIMDAATRALLGGLPVVFLDVGLHAAVQRVGLDAPAPAARGQPAAELARADGGAPPALHRGRQGRRRHRRRTPEDVAEAVLDALELKDA